VVRKLIVDAAIRILDCRVAEGDEITSPVPAFDSCTEALLRWCVSAWSGVLSVVSSADISTRNSAGAYRFATAELASATRPGWRPVSTSLQAQSILVTIAAKLRSSDEGDVAGR
jgi:hypothetical protein